MFKRFGMLLIGASLLVVSLRGTLAVASPKLAGSDAEGDAGPASERVYALYYLPQSEASLLLREKLGQQLADSGGLNLRIQTEPPPSSGPGSPTGFLHVWADPRTQEKVAAALKQVDVPPVDHVFQIFLLEGSRQTSVSPELPAGAAKALQDAKEILPFRGFRTLQSAVIRSTGEGFANLGMEFSLDFGFRAPREASRPVLFEKFYLRKQVPVPSGGSDMKAILQTSFSIANGETVVVGTSRLDGADTALVVLLTALK
jgi:hypothetical protein